MLRKMAATAAAGVIAGGLLLTGTAQATDGSGDIGCSTQSWVAHDWVDGVAGQPAESTVTADEVILVKTDGGVGTDASTSDLGLTGQTLTVDYELSGDASTDTTAIRFFAYEAAGADTGAGGTGPPEQDIADADSGTLTLDFGDSVDIGTVGVTYDTSNHSTGTVTFTDFELDGEPFSLTTGACETDPTDSNPFKVTVTQEGDCEVTIEYVNNNDFYFWGDYRLEGDQGTPDSEFELVPQDGDGPLGVNQKTVGDAHDHGVAPDQKLTQGDWAGSGETFGLQYNPVLLPPRSTVTETVEVDEATTVQARVWRGPNQSVYHPWTDPVEIACEPTDGQGGGDGDDEALPNTSGLSALPLFAIGGALLLLAGGSAMVLARRRGSSIS